jgi:hypothetical protein
MRTRSAPQSASNRAVAADGATFTFNFTRNLDATDLTLRVEATGDLGTTPWTPVATWTHGSG